MTRLLAAIVAALALAGVASAAAAPAGPLFWTRLQANAAISKGPTNGVWLTPIYTAAHHFNFLGYAKVKYDDCSPLGKPNHGMYQAFKCSVSWIVTTDVSGSVFKDSFWVRLYPGARTCASDRSLAECPPAVIGTELAGDPRGTYGEKAGGQMAAAAWSLTEAKLRTLGMKTDYSNVTCQAASAFLYGCTWFDGSSTVQWVRGKAVWSTKVTLNS